MTSARTEAEILKQDTRGRVRVSVERREALVDEFEKSALSGAKFARLAGVKYATFANWVARRRRQRAAVSLGESAPSNGVRPIRLFEAVVEGESGGTARVASAAEAMVVELPGGSRARVVSPVQLQWVAELVVLVAQGMRSRC
jgi:hypothetical protein